MQKQYTIGDIHKMIRTVKSTTTSTFVFTGKSAEEKYKAAEAVAASAGKRLMRVDLSQVVSKYISETVKNLDKIFARAEKSGTVLLFDEADALFGKRTGIGDAHDKYANAEASYLLQRAEQFSGVIIYAATSKTNLDDAFIRRVRATVSFPALKSLPKASQKSS
jgi:SpoVK/Ycf46/Vps4 family AAA+-type ATPase